MTGEGEGREEVVTGESTSRTGGEGWEARGRRAGRERERLRGGKSRPQSFLKVDAYAVVVLTVVSTVVTGAYTMTATAMKT